MCDTTSLLHLPLALLALVAPQKEPAQPGAYPAPLPAGLVTLDMDSGRMTLGPPQAQLGSAVSEFPNMDVNGQLGADLGGGNCAWFDAGMKGFSQSSDLVKTILLRYCASMPTAAVGLTESRTASTR